MICKIVNKSPYPLPVPATELAAGLDLRAHIAAPLTLRPLQRVAVETGIYMELPAGFEAQIRPRSGLAAKFGVTVLNAPGTIDADYRGEVKVLLVNLSSESYEVRPGDRIAQLVVAKFEPVTWQEVSALSDSLRGEGGLGSTGISDH